MPACSQNRRNPLTISAPGDASGPVIGGRKPMRIGPLSCACAAVRPANSATASAEARAILPCVSNVASLDVIAAPVAGCGMTSRVLVRRGAFRHDRRGDPLPVISSAPSAGVKPTSEFAASLNVAGAASSPDRTRNRRMDISTARFGSDHGALRSEDEPLLTGAGKFTDDLNVPGQAYGVFVRAPVGHASIRAIDCDGARKMPGVLGVYSGKDASADGLGVIPPVASFPGRDGKPMFSAGMPVLAAERIRYVGEPVAIVVAATLGEAQDAAEAVRIDYDELPAAPDLEGALAADATPIHEARPGNIALDWTDGNGASVESVFANATHVERLVLADTRL